MVRIGSKPQTPLRDTPAIFGTLIEDHDEHRRILAALGETRGKTAQRLDLLAELTYALNPPSVGFPIARSQRPIEVAS